MKKEGLAWFLGYLLDNHAVSMKVSMFIRHNNNKGQKLGRDLTEYTDLGVINV